MAKKWCLESSKELYKLCKHRLLYILQLFDKYMCISKERKGKIVQGTEEHTTQIKCWFIKNTIKNQSQKLLWTQRSPHSVAKAAAGESLFHRWLSCHCNLTWQWEGDISGVSFKVYSSSKDLRLQITSSCLLNFKIWILGRGTSSFNPLH